MSNDYSTRSQMQEEILTAAANKGEFYTYLKLFPNERKRLKRQGFTVVPKKIGNNEVLCTVHFLNAFSEGIPQIVLTYLLGISVHKPEYANNAQRLFSIAFKKAYCK